MLTASIYAQKTATVYLMSKNIFLTSEVQCTSELNNSVKKFTDQMSCLIVMLFYQ